MRPRFSFLKKPALRDIHSWFQEMWDDEETATISFPGRDRHQQSRGPEDGSDAGGGDRDGGDDGGDRDGGG